MSDAFERLEKHFITQSHREAYKYQCKYTQFQRHKIKRLKQVIIRNT